MRPVACKFDANQAVISMAARILTLACVVHQASSFAAPLSRPAGVVVDELLPLLDEGGTTRSRNKSPETIKQIDACLEELREAGRGAKVLDGTEAACTCGDTPSGNPCRDHPPEQEQR